MSSTFCFISADINYFFDTNVPMVLATHSAEDVGIWARGPMAHLFHGTHEQSYIAHVMMYASCVGPNQEHCENRAMSTPSSSPSPVTSETRETSSPSPVTSETRETSSPCPVTSETRETSSPSPVTSETRETSSPSPVTSETRETSSPCPVTSETRETSSPCPVTSGTRGTSNLTNFYMNFILLMCFWSIFYSTRRSTK